MILITGGAGYIGSHTVLNLIEKTDYKIIIFDNLENGHIETINTLLKINSEYQRRVDAKIIFEKGDLRNIEDIENVFNKYSIDGVIHFAAFALVEESVQNPSKYYRNNIYDASGIFSGCAVISEGNKRNRWSFPFGPLL